MAGFARSILLPVRLLEPSTVRALIETYLGRLRREFEINVPGVEYDLRDLLPTDLGLPADIWSEVTGSSAWEDTGVASKTMADLRWAVIWGVIDLSPYPCVSHVRFTVGGSTVAVWSLERMRVWGASAGIAMDPVIIPQNTPFTIERYVTVPKATAVLVFDGAVCEKRGKTIKPY